MKLIYTHENKILVENARNFLKEQGVDSVLRNEFASGGMGELSPIETWPEVWVADTNYTTATKIINSYLTPVSGDTWRCQNCGEENEANFECCWQCLHFHE